MNQCAPGSLKSFIHCLPCERDINGVYFINHTQPKLGPDKLLAAYHFHIRSRRHTLSRVFGQVGRGKSDTLKRRKKSIDLPENWKFEVERIGTFSNSTLFSSQAPYRKSVILIHKGYIYFFKSSGWIILENHSTALGCGRMTLR